MVIFDALDMKFRNVKLRPRNVNCASCGDEPTITDVSTYDYDSFCGVAGCGLSQTKLPAENTITIGDFHKLRAETEKPLCIVDVREKVQHGDRKSVV